MTDRRLDGASLRRRRLGLGAAAALVAGNVVLHEWVSDVCRAIEGRIGFAALDRGALIAITVTSVLLAIATALGRGATRPQARPTIGLLALVVVTLAVHRILIVNNIEVIHFPQYALLAGALMVAGVGPRGAWALASLAGIADELVQYLEGYVSRSDTYVDTNDMVLNVVGAAWAVLLVFAWRTPMARSATRWRPWLRGSLLSLAVAVLVALLVLAPPGWTVRHGAFERAYYVLSASTAYLVGALVFGIIVWSDPRRRTQGLREAAVAGEVDAGAL